jgi:uncharacterized protein (DUF2252 family)
MIHFDPYMLARWQLARDREATRRFPGLFERKLARMVASPFAFLRGSARLYYEVLRQQPELAEGPDGEGQLIGDLHLENFGAYRPAAFDGGGAVEHDATFGLNDFDDATIGPWRFDLLRLATSLILAGRELGARGSEGLVMVEGLLDAWNRHAHAPKTLRPPPVPPSVVALVEQVRARPRQALLDARTTVTKGRRCFVRGPRYRNLPARLVRQVPEAMERYLESLDVAVRPPAERLRVLDAAFRVAGIGSLGVLRIAVLVTGKGGSDGGWVFDLKEQGQPSSHQLLTPPRRNGAKRVRDALCSCLAQPPKMVGVTRLDERPMLVRRLTPQDDKLDLGRVDHRELPSLARYLGALVGEAHRRGAIRQGKPWRADEQRSLLERAVGLAGLHEATSLALCDLSRR